MDCGGFVDRSGGVSRGRGRVCGSGDGVGGTLFDRGSVCGSGVSGSSGLVSRSGVGWSSGLVSWGGVGGSFVVGCDVFGVFGFTGVLDVGDISVAVGSVGDNLGAAVGKDDAV